MRKYSLAVMAFLVVLMCFTPALMAQSNPLATKEENIRKFLKLIGAKDTVTRSMEEQINEMKTKNVNRIPPKFWDELLKEYDYDKFVELLVPIYDKHFSNDDLEGLIAFYETPLGRKLASKLPQILDESMAAAQKYGEQINNQVIKRMQAEGTFPSAAPDGDGKPLPPRR